MRERISARVAEALIARDERGVTLKLLPRDDVPIPRSAAGAAGRPSSGIDDAEMRGALLGRDDLPAAARLVLVEAAVAALRGCAHRQGRDGRAAARAAAARRDGHGADRDRRERGRDRCERRSPRSWSRAERLSTRVMLHAVVNGHVLFFADCLADAGRDAARKSLHAAGNRQPAGAQCAAGALRAGRGGAQPHRPADLPCPRGRPRRRCHGPPLRRHRADRGTDRRA